MPYEIRKSGTGYKVFKKGGSKAFSKTPLSKDKAKAQLAAMYANSAEGRAVPSQVAMFMEAAPTVGFATPANPLLLGGNSLSQDRAPEFTEKQFKVAKRFIELVGGIDAAAALIAKCQECEECLDYVTADDAIGEISKRLGDKP